MHVDARGLDRAVPGRGARLFDGGAAVEGVGEVRVAEGVRADRLLDAGPPGRLPHDVVDLRAGQRAAFAAPEERILRPAATLGALLAAQLQQHGPHRGAKEHRAFLFAFAEDGHLSALSLTGEVRTRRAVAPLEGGELRAAERAPVEEAADH